MTTCVARPGLSHPGHRRAPSRVVGEERGARVCAQD